MQLQFERKPIGCLRHATQENLNFEETLELRLHDSGGGTVLCAKGQPLIRGKEWRQGRIGVLGGVAVSVLYISDEDNTVRCCEGWLPFQRSLEIPEGERDGSIVASCHLQSLDARMTGADKVMVTASISLCAEALRVHKVQVAEAGEVPRDVQLLQQRYPVCVAVEAGEKPMALDEELVLPPGKAEIDRIYHASLQPGNMELKLMADKLVFRGSAVLTLLYMGVDGQVGRFEATLPLSQYVQLERQYGEDAYAQICCAVTDLETDRLEDGRIRLKGGLVGQYVVYDRPMVTVLEDAYSNKRTVTPQQEPLALPQMLEQKDVSKTIECTFPVEARSVVCCSVMAAHPRISGQNGQMIMRLEGTAQLLYYDGDDQLQCVCSPWEAEETMPGGDGVNMFASLHPVMSPQYSLTDSAVNMQCDLTLRCSCFAEKGIPSVVGLDIAEGAPREQRPGVVLKRAGTESLWQLAKRCGSTVDAICKANGLDGEPAADKMLLIPME